MTEVYSEDGSDSSNHDRFSACSVRNITEGKFGVLAAIDKGEVVNCFREAEYDPEFEPELAVCGNGVTHDGYKKFFLTTLSSFFFFRPRWWSRARSAIAAPSPGTAPTPAATRPG